MSVTDLTLKLQVQERRRKGSATAGSRGYSPEFLRDVVKAISNGESHRSISRRMGLSSATIWRWTKEAA